MQFRRPPPETIRQPTPPTWQDIEKLRKEAHGAPGNGIDYIKSMIAVETQKRESYRSAIDTQKKNLEYLQNNFENAAALVADLERLLRTLKPE